MSDQPTTDPTAGALLDGGPGLDEALARLRSLSPEDRAQLQRLIGQLQREAADRLHARDEQLHLVLDAGRMGTWEWDLRTGAQRWSPELERLFGLPPGSGPYTPADFYRLVHPDDLPAIQASAAQAMAEGRDSIDDVFRVVRPDGGVLWFASRTLIARDREGRAVHMAGVNTDITAHRQTEDRLLRLQEVSARFAEAQTLNEVREAVLDAVARTIGADRIVMRWIAEPGLVEDEGAPGRNLDGTPAQPGPALPFWSDHPAAAAARDGEPRFSPDPRVGSAAGEAGGSSAHLPLRRGDELFGVLSMEFAASHRWDEAEQTFALTLTSRVAVAYERARLFEAERREREQSERLQAELQSRNETLTALLTACPLAVMVLERDGAVQLWNPAAERLFGWTADEVVGRFLPAIDDDDRPGFLRRLEAIVGGQNIAGLEAIRRKKDGTFAAQIWTAPLTLADGRRQIVSVIADITERKRAEAALRDSEARMQLAMRANRMVTWEWDVAADEITNSSSFSEVYGLPALAGVNDGFALVFDEDRRDHRAKVQRLAAEGGEYRSEFRITRPDSGQIVWMEERAVALLGPGGAVERVVGVTLDVTSRKRAEMNLAFLAEISRDLAQVSDLDAMMQVVGAKIGAYLGLSICAFAMVDEAGDEASITHDWHRDDRPSVVGVYRLADFLTADFQAAARRGELFAVRDTAVDARVDAGRYAALGIRSFVSVPLVRDGRWRFMINLYDDAPRAWRDDELALMREVTARVWTSIERRRAEQDLRTSEARYRTLFTSIDEGFCVIEMIFEGATPVDYRFIEINPTFEQQTGLRNAEGRTARELVPNLELRWFQVYGGVALTGEPVRFVEGSEAMGRWFDVYAFRVGEAGSRRVALLFNDITERKRRERDIAFLAEIGDELARLTDSAALMRLAAERVGGYFGVDHCVCVELDLGAETAAVPCHWRAAPGPDHAGQYRLTPTVIGAFRQALGAAIVIPDVAADPRTQAWRASSPGLDRGALLAAPNVRDEALQVMLIYSHAPRAWREDEVELLRELSARIWMRVERARAEERLTTANYRFRLAEEAAKGFNYEWDLERGAVLRSESVARVLGYTREEIGAAWQAWTELIHPEDRWLGSEAEAVALVQAHQDEILSSEYRVRHRDGHYLWLLERAIIVRDERGRAWRVIGQTVDITERKELEAERERLYAQEQAARAQAEEASRLKDEFLATVSHELRTPLTAFLGYAQLLQSRKRDEAYVARTVEKMVRSAKAQAQLIEDLLDVSRIVSGKLRLEARPLDLAAVVQAAVDTVRPMVEARSLRLRVGLPPGELSVVGDANRLEQVVWNLLTNAAKFTPEGGAVDVALEAAGGHARLTVSDTGQGISPAFLPYMFDPFRQADSTSQRPHGGLGLGLAIVRRLAELHGGSVQASSPGVGQGATFTVRLPLAAAGAPQDDPADGAPLEVAPVAYPPELRGLRVLVVDDQPDLLELLHEILAPSGADVRLSSSAREALEQLRSWRPDVLLSDIAMPGEDGYWLIRAVRALDPAEGGATPAAALTAYVRMEDRLRVLAEGYQLYVPKPVDPAELLDILARLAQ